MSAKTSNVFSWFLIVLENKVELCFLLTTTHNWAKSTRGKSTYVSQGTYTSSDELWVIGAVGEYWVQTCLKTDVPRKQYQALSTRNSSYLDMHNSIVYKIKFVLEVALIKKCVHVSVTISYMEPTVL